MRKIHPEIGDRRIKSRFLLLPKRIEDETRWLEYTSWVQEYKEACEFDCGTVFSTKCWVDIEWSGIPCSKCEYWVYRATTGTAINYGSCNGNHCEIPVPPGHTCEYAKLKMNKER